MNKIQQEDILAFAQNFELSDFIVGSRFLVTGATGLIGSTLVHCLIALDRAVDITCPVRNIAKAQAMYGENFEKIHFVECDLLEYLNNLTTNDYFDYIVHCASPTSGKYMVEFPVETYTLAIDSTRSILKHIYKTNAKGFVYISSIEYYGQNSDDKIIKEDVLGYVDNTDPRSSYSLGKRAAEFLCAAYANQYGVNANVARLTQTFGPGIAIDDNRVFAQFARSVISNNNIVLHTSGMSAKPYCYTTDCISAILYILLKGKKGESYNVANEDTYISVRDMADFLRKNFNPKIKVIIEEHPEMCYAPVTRLHLSAEKLMSIGWKPSVNLKEMYNRLIKSLTL